MAKNNGYYSRKWLNKKEGHAFIEVKSYAENNGCEVVLGDCSRNITLDFFVSNRSTEFDCTKEGRLYKMDRLISELQKARTIIAGDDDANS